MRAKKPPKRRSGSASSTSFVVKVSLRNVVDSWPKLTVHTPDRSFSRTVVIPSAMHDNDFNRLEARMAAWTVMSVRRIVRAYRAEFGGRQGESP